MHLPQAEGHVSQLLVVQKANRWTSVRVESPLLHEGRIGPSKRAFRQRTAPLQHARIQKRAFLEELATRFAALHASSEAFEGRTTGGLAQRSDQVRTSRRRERAHRCSHGQQSSRCRRKRHVRCIRRRLIPRGQGADERTRRAA
eukprot:scaffold584_cov338-Pavlova_lutheri.AAC.29